MWCRNAALIRTSGTRKQRMEPGGLTAEGEGDPGVVAF
jgi:hypothetical protein